MSRSPLPMRPQERGSALVVALFVITIVAALGVIAIRLGGTQTQAASLEMEGYRAELAARAGIEAFANRVAAGASACPGTPANIAIGTAAGNGNFAVRLATCTRIASGAAAVYEIEVIAERGAFGEPNFVRRTVFRRLSTIGVGTY